MIPLERFSWNSSWPVPGSGTPVATVLSMITRLVSIIGFAVIAQIAQASTPAAIYDAANKRIMNARTAIDEKLAKFYSGDCPKVAGLTPQSEARLEERFFPFAAGRLINFNSCAASVISRLTTDGYRGQFAKQVIADIAVKLPTLRKLSHLADALSHNLDGLK